MASGPHARLTIRPRNGIAYPGERTISLYPPNNPAGPMPRQSPPPKSVGARRERGSISSGEIIEGAISLAREVGIEGLSMPKLSQSLGIGVTSIYWYFQNKEDLLNELTTVAAQQYHARLPTFDHLPWPDYLLQHFKTMHQVLTEDELLCDLLFFRNSKFSVEALERIWPDLDKTMHLLVDAGFPTEQAIHAHFLLSHYTRGCITLERLIRKSGKTAHIPVRLPRSFDATRFPLLASVGEWHSLRGTTPNEFEGGLRVAIEGLKAMIGSRSKAYRPALRRAVTRMLKTI